jgi:uncharacterized protein (TIGR02301 family)
MSRNLVNRAAVVWLAVALAGGPAAAQTSLFGFGQPESPPAPSLTPAPGPPAIPPGALRTTPAPAAPTAPPPYQHDLERLVEILGALHFLRGVCGANEGQKWRNEAQALIDAEAPNGERHDAMIASFNRGYRAFQQSYRSCTPAADFAVRRYLAEGARIARDVTARYAN